MSRERQNSVGLHFAVFVFILVAAASKALGFKAGKENITTVTPGLFACKKISFQYPFSGGQQVKVFASFGHTEKSPNPRNGAAIWVEDVMKSGFTPCVVEFGDSSNGTKEVSWIAVQTAPFGSQIGIKSLSSWTTGTKCERIDFKQRFPSPPTIFVTATHGFTNRTQDAMALWVEDLKVNSFKICLREARIFDGPHKKLKVNWIAFNNISVDNFTLINSLVFSNVNSPSPQNNYAFCQTINFTEPFYAPPVVLVTAKRSTKTNNSRQSASQCNAVTTWVEHTSENEAQICFKTFNSDSNNKDVITVDYIVTGDLDPCIDVVCHYHCLCRAFGPFDARCVSVESCPSYEEPICSSNGSTYDNECLFQQEMCVLRLNYTVQHPGSCEECQSYRSLTSGTRRVTDSSNGYCDNGLSGWYRFQGAAGSRMATSCPPISRCGTSATGWLSGGHPTVADGRVNRLACFHWSSNCCYWSHHITVRNCGAFYVYSISSTPYAYCHLRHCSTS